MFFLNLLPFDQYFIILIKERVFVNKDRTVWNGVPIIERDRARPKSRTIIKMSKGRIMKMQTLKEMQIESNELR